MRTNDLLAHFTDALSLFLKVVSHQLFADADASVLAVLRFTATVQIFVEIFEGRGKPFQILVGRFVKRELRIKSLGGTFISVQSSDTRRCYSAQNDPPSMIATSNRKVARLFTSMTPKCFGL
jgi:hypothetical protein